MRILCMYRRKQNEKQKDSINKNIFSFWSINFSGAFLPLIDVLLNTVGTPPTLKAALQQEVKTYKDEKILHALGWVNHKKKWMKLLKKLNELIFFSIGIYRAYSSEVANIPAVKDEEVIQSIKYLFVVSARSEFR